jgi:hypothetical protein
MGVKRGVLYCGCDARVRVRNGREPRLGTGSSRDWGRGVRGRVELGGSGPGETTVLTLALSSAYCNAACISKRALNFEAVKFNARVSYIM